MGADYMAFFNNNTLNFEAGFAKVLLVHVSSDEMEHRAPPAPVGDKLSGPFWRIIGQKWNGQKIHYAFQRNWHFKPQAEITLTGPENEIITLEGLDNTGAKITAVAYEVETGSYVSPPPKAVVEVKPETKPSDSRPTCKPEPSSAADIIAEIEADDDLTKSADGSKATLEVLQMIDKIPDGPRKIKPSGLLPGAEDADEPMDEALSVLSKCWDQGRKIPFEGYYSYGIPPSGRILDPPVQIILERKRGTEEISGEGVDGPEVHFKLTGKIWKSGFMALVKEYDDSHQRYLWIGAVSPAGIAGVWTEVGSREFKGMWYIWVPEEFF